MLRRIKMALALIIVGTIPTVYAACYLRQVAVCFLSGAQVATITIDCGSVSYTAALYANENAYKWTRYTVTAAGWNTSNPGTYCSDSPSNPGQLDGFDVSYYDGCIGSPAIVNVNTLLDPYPWSEYTLTSQCN